MKTGILLPFAFSLYTIATSALPSGLREPSLAKGYIDIISLISNATSSSPQPPHPVKCLVKSQPPELSGSDCSYILNDVILRLPGVFQQRIFAKESYMTEFGGYIRAQWRFNHCEIKVKGLGPHNQRFTLFDVALTANKIIAECVNGVTNSAGGASAIGDPSKFFAVFLNGYDQFGATAENFNVSLQHELSVSRRAIKTQDDSEDAGGLHE